MIGWLIMVFVYAPLMLARRDGQTFGHRVTSTRVVMADGTPIGGGMAFVREVLVKWGLFELLGSAFLLIPLLANYLWPLWDKNNEALHDKVCRTRVVET